MLDQHLRRLLALLAFGLVLGLLAATQKVYFERGVVPGDAFTYLAAGERLNAGHPLYALSPGDRPVELNPPQWTIPLVSPPPIAVLWRPLAALPSELGVYLWWAAQLAALAASLAMLARRRPFTTAGAMLALLFPTVYEIGVGNVNSFLLLGLILTWRAARDGREATAGAIPALMTAVKLTPVVLGWWLLVTGHRGAVVAALVTGAAIVAVSLVGAGIDTHVEYLRILADRSAIGSSPLSMAGMARYVGVPDAIASLLPTACALLGAIAVFVLRRRPALSFVAAVLAMLYGSPAVSINWYILLYALIAPLAWPMRAGEPSPQPFPATGGTANTQPSAPA